MQAAFIDIGWERNAYLALEDLVVGEELDGCNPNIGDILKAGQLVVVQIKKEAVDLKGPKVSCKLSLAGAYAGAGTRQALCGCVQKNTAGEQAAGLEGSGRHVADQSALWLDCAHSRAGLYHGRISAGI